MSEHRYISLKDILRNQPMQAEFKLEQENKGKNSQYSNLVSSKGSCSDSSYESPGGEDEDNDDVRGKNTKARVKKKNKGKCTRTPSMRMSKSDNPLLYTEFGGSCSSEDDLKDLSLEMRNLSWEERTLRSNVISQSEEEANDNEDEEEEEEANN